MDWSLARLFAKRVPRRRPSIQPMGVAGMAPRSASRASQAVIKYSASGSLGESGSKGNGITNTSSNKGAAHGREVHAHEDQHQRRRGAHPPMQRSHDEQPGDHVQERKSQPERVD